MRHPLLVLPLLALAAAGCSEPCTSPALTVSWRFDLADGTRAATCQAAGVATVVLSVDGLTTGGTACEQGSATFGGLAAGPHDLVVQGRSAAGAVLYQQWGQVELAGCGETRTTVDAGAGHLRVGYATSTGLCWAADDPLHLTGFIWYQVVDTVTGLTVAVVNGTHDPAALPCQEDAAQREIDLQLPWGRYTLRWIQDVRDPVSASPVAVYQDCTPADVTLRTPGVTSLDVTLDPVSGPCTP